MTRSLSVLAVAIAALMATGSVGWPQASLEGLDGGLEKSPHFALLIGNADYNGDALVDPQASPVDGSLRDLKNGCNDVTTIQAGLVTMGWKEDDVRLLCDATTDTIASALRTFVDRFQKADAPTAMIYFAGHGVQINRRHYIFGARAKPDLAGAARLLQKSPKATLFYKDAIDLNYELANIGRITDGALLVVLDACRNNPLLASLRGKAGVTSFSAPGNAVEPPSGVVTEFSTSEGAFADDGMGDNSPFALAFAERLRGEINIEDVLAEVGTKVETLTEDWPTPQKPQKAGYFAQPPRRCFNGCLVDQANSVGARGTEAAASGQGRGAENPTLGLPRAIRLPENPQMDLPAMPNPGRPELAGDLFGKGGEFSNGPQIRFDRSLDDLTGLPKADPAIAAAKLATSQLHVDVFVCDGADAKLRYDLAAALGASIATISRYDPVQNDAIIGRVRLRGLSRAANSTPDFSYASNVIVYDKEDARASAWAASIARASPFPLERQESRAKIPDYVSIFVCDKAGIDVPAGSFKQTIYFQIADKAQENAARQAIASLKLAVPSARISDALDYQPKASPKGSEVRYFFADDEGAATALARAVGTILGADVIPKRSTDVSKAARGRLEIWLGQDDASSQVGFWTTNDAALKSQSMGRILKDAFP